MSHNANEHRPLSTSAPTSSAPQLRDARPFASRPDEDVEAWLIHYKRVSAANRWDAASQLLYVLFFLTDTASMWYENREETLTTWDRFVSEIKERFGDPTMIKKRAEQTLMQRTQVPGKTCTTYIEEVIKLCRTIDSGMSEEDKVGHILKGIAEDVYSFLIAKDTLTSVTDVIRHCRTFEQLKTRRITPKFGRLPNVTTITSIDSNQALDLATTIRQVVREELGLYAQVANCPSTHPPYQPPEFERNVASFSSHRVAEGFEDSDATPQYDRGPAYDARSRRAQPHSYTQGSQPDYVPLRQGQYQPYYQDVIYDEYNEFQRVAETRSSRDNELPRRQQRPRIRSIEYSINRDPPVCYNCGFTGHIARYCRQQRRQSRKTPAMSSPPRPGASYDLRTTDLFPKDRFSRETRRSDSPASEWSLTPPSNRSRRSPSPVRRSSPPPGN
ncbi:uncharacterized protein LOC119169209 [Rhipicephalus microplus]|uniref:uncharacterized protein LOC119169209 n=1 Tax=Rhipicephalus microplus TaxID=6941 RepID=UPI003F6C7B2B